MSEYIDLQPELIEALNEKIMKILNMPEELLRQYTTKPYITEDDQATLEKAGVAYQSKIFPTAVAHYKTFFNKQSHIHVGCPNGQTQLSIVVQYLLSNSLMESKEFIDLLEAQNILLRLEKTVAQKYPMIYYALGKFHIKLFNFKEADHMINKGLGILNGSSESLINCYVPITNDIIVESTSQGLSTELLKLKKLCMIWHRPDAVCFMTNCHLNSHYHLSGRNIHFDSPAFNGMVTFACNNIDACNTQFHAACWKVQKKILSSGQKISDKDLLGSNCFTPNCEHDSIPSKIRKIDILSKDKVTKVIELPLVKQDQSRNTKGATRKRRVKLIDAGTAAEKMETKLPSAKTVLNGLEVLKNTSDIRQKLELRISNLNHLLNDRHRYAQFHSCEKSNMNPDKEQPNSDWQNNSEHLADLESVVYTYFNKFISYHGQVKVTVVQKKWEDLWDSHEDNSICENIIDFLCQSRNFLVIDGHIYTSESLPENYTLMNDKAHVTMSNLKGKNFNSKLEHKDSDGISSCISDTDLKSKNPATVVINPQSPTIETDEEKIPNGTSDRAEEMPSDMHDTENGLMSDEKLPYSTEKIECENEIPINNDIYDDSVATSQVTYEKSNGQMDSVLRQLEIVQNKLRVKEFQLTNMKMTMLRMDLDAQYMTMCTSINSTLVICQKEYGIIERMQYALVKYVGTALPLEKSEWLEPIEALKRNAWILQQMYNEKLVEINSIERCKKINTVHLKLPNLPVLPNRDIPELIQLAFDMCHNHFRSSQRIPPVMIHNPFLPPLLPNPPILVPPCENYAQNLNHITRPTPPLFTAHPPCDPTHLQLQTNINSQTYMSTTSVSEQTSTVDGVNHSPENSQGVLKTEAQEAKCEKVTSENQAVDPVNMSNNDEHENEVTKTRNKKPSSDLLMELLRSRNNGVMEYDLLWCVSQVRKKHNNSLTGLSLSVIMNAVEKQLVHRRKLQLADYSVRRHREVQRDLPNQRQRQTSFSSTSSHVSAAASRKDSTIRKNPSSTTGSIGYDDRGPPNQRRRQTSVSSTSSLTDVSAASSRKDSTIRKNPWGMTAGSSISWKNDFEQSNCVICLESLRTCPSHVLYTSQCKHTFHKECITKWFKRDQSCPSCRKHCLMDSAFPPL